jgi:molybdate transport repressor ModE-like protein
MKVWLEGQDGNVAVSDWRVALLEAIGRHTSLAAAAREMGVPHRTAWQRLREMEERLGIRLVDASSGGASGGHSHLTADGEELVRRFRTLTGGFEEQLDERFRASFGPIV